MNLQETQLINLLKVNTKIIQIIGYETLLIHANLVDAARELGRDLYHWNHIEGIKKWDAGNGVFSDKGGEPQARRPEMPCTFFAK